MLHIAQGCLVSFHHCFYMVYHVNVAVLYANHNFSRIRLKELNESTDISSLARYIIKQCPVIPDFRLVELEQILFYLQKRQRLMNAGEIFTVLHKDLLPITHSWVQ